MSNSYLRIYEPVTMRVVRAQKQFLLCLQSSQPCFLTFNGHKDHENKDGINGLFGVFSSYICMLIIIRPCTLVE